MADAGDGGASLRWRPQGTPEEWERTKQLDKKDAEKAKEKASDVASKLKPS